MWLHNICKKCRSVYMLTAFPETSRLYLGYSHENKKREIHTDYDYENIHKKYNGQHECIT